MQREPSEHRAKIFGWLSFENAVSLVLTIVVIIGAFNAVKSDVRDTNTKLDFQTARIDEQQRRMDRMELTHLETHDAVLRIEGDVKALLKDGKAK
jgi:hypothetical protein